MSKIALSGNPSGTGTFTIASPNSNTDRTVVLPDVGGTVAVASSGTPSSSTFLRGDNTWAAVSTTPTTQQVLDATAGATAGAVGTYGLFILRSGSNVAAGDTRAGSALAFTDAAGVVGATPTGTWRAMGITSLVNAGNNSVTVFLRIS